MTLARGFAVGVILVSASGLAPSMAAAQEDAPTNPVVTTDGSVATGAEAQDDEPFDGRSTDDTVRLVVWSLIAIAGATAVMMFVFIWHTSPRRRLRIATRRTDRRRAKERARARATGQVTSDDILLEEADEEDIDAHWTVLVASLPTHRRVTGEEEEEVVDDGGFFDEDDAELDGDELTESRD